MKAQTLKLFPNFAKIIRRSGSKRNLQNLKEEEASSQNVYVNYVTHVNSLNGFKKEMCDTSLIDDVAKLVYSGETLSITRSCIGEINAVWNNWERCYDILRNDYVLLDNKALMVSRTFKDSIESLNALCENPNDPYAKENLNFAVQYMKTYLTGSIGITETVINEVHDFHDISYDKQYEYFDKIIAQLSKESSLKEKERDAVTARIRQLRNDIASYNASIAALAISLGVSCTMIVGTFFISGGYGIVITLFILPAVAAAVTELVKIVSKLKTAKKEIA